MATPTFYEELTAMDSFFLYAERPEAPLHIGGVYVFEGRAANGGRGPLGIVETLQERLHLVPRYRQRVRFRPFNVGHPVWVDDPDFDLSYHVRRSALPRPGDDAALREYTARVMARPLDTSKPLWEMYVVEGLTEGRVALISKVHHAMVDGIASLDIGTLLFDIDAGPPVPPPPRRWRPRPEPDGRTLALDMVRTLSPGPGVARLAALNPLRMPVRVPALLRQAGEAALAGPWAGAASLALSFLRPGRQLFFNRMIGAHRRVHHLALPLAMVKEVKDAFGGTVNDVILALVAEAMRRWLLERDEEVPAAMRVFCPVSVRDDSRRYALGNLVSGMVVELPLSAMPPLTRLARVSAATGDLKRSRQAMAAHSISALTGWAPATLHALGARLASERRTQVHSVVNMVVTNVPGPQIPFYTGGAEMLEVWPLVPVYHSLGLNLALFSYNGSIHFGLNADRDLVTGLDRLARHLGRAAGEYQALARRLQAAPERRPAAAAGNGSRAAGVPAAASAGARAAAPRRAAAARGARRPRG